MPDFSAGTVYVQVLPSLDGWRRNVREQLAEFRDLIAHITVQPHIDKDALAKELADLKITLTPAFETDSSGAKKEADKAAGAFADAFKSRVAAALKSLPQAEITADSTPADAVIAGVRERLAELKDVTIGVDLSDREALAELEAMQRVLATIDGEDVTIQARFDAQAAATELRAFGEQVRAAGRRDGGAFADAFTASVKAALAKLPDARLDADASPVDVEIHRIRTELESLSGKRIGIDITDDDALATLDRLRERLATLDKQGATLRARFDATQAFADLDRFRTQVLATGKEADRQIAEVRLALSTLAGRKVGVDIDDDEARRHLDELKAKLTELAGNTVSVHVRAEVAKALADLALVDAAIHEGDGEEVRVSASDGGSINLLHTRMQRLIAVVVAGSGAIGGLAATVAALGAGAVVGAAGLGTLAAGATTIGAAMKAQSDASRQAGQSAAQEAAQRVTAANQVLNAQEQILSAQENLASATSAVGEAARNASNAVRTALQGQTRAEEQLQATQTAALRAQEALTAARDNAARSIEDLRNKAIDDALAQRQAILNLEDASTALARVRDDPAATERQRTEAQLNFELAQQHLAEISLSYKRSQADAATAAKAGVDGSKQVVSAQDALLAAQRDYRAAQTASIEAERKVAEARLDGARAVSQAQLQAGQAARSLEQAQRGLVAAQANSTTQAQKQGEAHEKFAEALDKLSPSSLRLVEYLRAQGGEWQSLTQAAQGFAPGVQKGLQALEPAFPALNANVATLSASTGDFIEVLARGLVNAQPFFDVVASSSQSLFPRFGESVNRAAGAAGQLVLELLPLAPQALDTADAFSELVRGWSPLIAQASGPLVQSLQAIIRNLDFLGPLLVAVAGPAGDLTEVLVGGLRQGFVNITPELHSFLAATIDLIGSLTPLIGSAGTLTGSLLDVLSPAIHTTAIVVQPLVDLLDLLVGFVASFPAPMVAMVGGFLLLRKAVEPLQDMLTNVARRLGEVASQAAVFAAGPSSKASASAAKFATAMERTSASLSKVGSALPFLGVALVGIGEVFGMEAEENRRHAEKIDELARAYLRGGDAAAQAAIWVQQFGVAAGISAAQVEAAARKQAESMTGVQVAQSQAAQAQLDYDNALKQFGPNAVATQAAHQRLITSTQGVKRAQQAAADATKTATQRLQDQQDQILAMADAKNATERAGLQLDRAKLRISQSDSEAQQARADLARAQARHAQIAQDQGAGSEGAKQAAADVVDARQRIADADISAKEARLDLASAQSRYVAAARDEAVASAQAAGQQDLSAAATRGNNDALIQLARTQGEAMPASLLSMLAGMSDADKALYGLQVTVDATGRTILSLPGAPGQPPVQISFVDNLPHIKEEVINFGSWLADFAVHLFGASGPGITAPGMDPDRLLALGLTSVISRATTPARPSPTPRPTPLRRARGGSVPGSGSTDSVAALLTPGEFVFSRPAVARLGPSTVAAMHASAVRGYAAGGLVAPVRLAAGGFVPDQGGSPLAWLAALAATTRDITGAVDPLALALQQQLIPALGDTANTSALLTLSAASNWTSIAEAVDTSTGAITAGYLPALRGELSQVDSAVGRTAATFGTQWAAIRGYAADPVRFALSGPFNALIAAWNLIDATFAVGKPLTPLAVAFARGGSVAGGTPGKDSVLAALMPGEFVVPVPMVNQIGMANLEAARRSVLRGGGVEGLIPGYEAGGAVSKALLFASSQVGKPYIWGASGPDGYDCCLVGGTRIYGPDGAKPIRDVHAGDRVYSYVDGERTVQTVTAAWQSKRQPVFSVRARNRAVTASANHPFMRLVVTEPAHPVPGGRHGEMVPAQYGIAWARLDELQRGDLLVAPRALPVEAKPMPTLADGTEVDADIAWLLGTILGDGTVSGRNFRLCLFAGERDRAAAILNSRWGGTCTFGDTYGLAKSSKRLQDTLTALGLNRTSHDKRLPEEVWSWNGDLQRAFLDGYCDTDGHRPANTTRHGERTYSSSSRELLEDIRALHLTLGDPVSNVSTTRRTKPIVIHGKTVKNARTLYTFSIWRGRRTGEAALRLRSGIAQWLDSGDFTLVRVQEVRPEGEQDTWDLEVEGAHNFVADGVVVHNSGFVSAVLDVLLGLPPYTRRFTTGDFAPGRGAAGFVPGRDSTFVVGVSDSHMAATLAGHNLESTTKNGISGVRVDGDAAGALDRQFSKGQFYLPQIGGQFVPGPSGAGLLDFAALLGSTFSATRDSIAQIGTLFAGNTFAAGASAAMTHMVDAVVGWAATLLGGPSTPGSGPVADQVRGVAARFGWGGGPQWAALSTLVGHESSWNPTAQNPISTAFGLFQLLDATWADTGISKTSNPALQAEAGLRYIQQRYGDPVNAWNFWGTHRWYDDGGYLPPGLSLAYNGTSRPEPVLTAEQWQTVGQGGGAFTGTLTLDSGEFLGVVRGQIDAANQSTGTAIARRTRL